MKLRINSRKLYVGYMSQNCRLTKTMCMSNMKKWANGVGTGRISKACFNKGHSEKLWLFSLSRYPKELSNSGTSRNPSYMVV